MRLRVVSLVTIWVVVVMMVLSSVPAWWGLWVGFTTTPPVVIPTPAATLIPVTPTSTPTATSTPEPPVERMCVTGVFMTWSGWGWLTVGEQTLCGIDLEFSPIRGPTTLENPLRQVQ